MAQIDALLLDLGNVLALHDNAKLWRELGAAFGTTAERLERSFDAELEERVGRGITTGDELRQELGARVGRALEPERWRALWSCHFTVNEPMVRHVERLVGRLRLVLLSNTNAQHFDSLAPRLPVLARFDALVLSHEHGLIKPEPRIYELALARAGVPATRAAFFDDREPYVGAASALGIHGRLFRSAADFPAQLAALGVAL